MRIAVFGSDYQQKHVEHLAAIFRELARRNAWVAVEESFYRYLCRLLPEPPQVNDIITGDDFDAALVLSIGGDGTFLRTARCIGAREIPVLGINTGHLGYLADAGADEFATRIDDIFEGRFRIESRTMIAVTSDAPDFTADAFALNEVAIMKKDTSSMIDMEAWIDGARLANYLADGLIVSTPTGSTGYNLSVGGPIVAPQAPVWVVSPIAAHSLSMRPLVVDDRSVISVITRSRSESYRVSLDGQSFSMNVGTTITMRRAPFVTKVVQSVNHRFVDTLRTKLLWGIDKR